MMQDLETRKKAEEFFLWILNRTQGVKLKKVFTFEYECGDSYRSSYLYTLSGKVFFLFEDDTCLVMEYRLPDCLIAEYRTLTDSERVKYTKKQPRDLFNRTEKLYNDKLVKITKISLEYDEIEEVRIESRLHKYRKWQKGELDWVAPTDDTFDAVTFVMKNGKKINIYPDDPLADGDTLLLLEDAEIRGFCAEDGNADKGVLLSLGRNNFDDRIFSPWEWSAPIFQSCEALSAKIDKLKLCGRTIRGFHSAGMAFNWDESSLGEAVYDQLDIKIKNGELSANAPYPYLPDQVCLRCVAVIDAPFLIMFEDGDALNIDFSEASSVRIAMNTLPTDIKDRGQSINFHPDRLFKSLIGSEIIDVEMTTSKVYPVDYTESFGLPLYERDNYIKTLTFICRTKDKAIEKLEFTNSYDYGDITLRDDDGAVIQIPAADARDIVEGYIDDEILDYPCEYDLCKE